MRARTRWSNRTNLALLTLTLAAIGVGCHVDAPSTQTLPTIGTSITSQAPAHDLSGDGVVVPGASPSQG